MTTKEKMIFMYNEVHGPISKSCYWEYDDEEHALICMKDDRECWRITREEVLFDYLTKDMTNAS